MKYKLALCGEAWGEEEQRQGKPFVGASGRELDRMLAEAGIEREECYVTNCFNQRPPGNKIEAFCAGKKEVTHSLPPLFPGKFIRDDYLFELQRLYAELRSVRPNVVVCLGNTAVWALLGSTGISKIRGTVARSVVPGLDVKCLPSFHPAAILREWSLRHVTVLDLRKAKRESEWPEVRIPKREIWIEPTISDLGEFYDRYIADCSELSFDIETVADQITCIGFAPRNDLALVVPFTDNRTHGGSYWRDRDSEVAVWRFVKRVLNHPCRKVGQNILYDIGFLWRQYGIAVRNVAEDTMLLHYSLLPESEKSLAFLGSVYTSSPEWKSMRGRGPKTIKAED